jgi:hypothetical protein
MAQFLPCCTTMILHGYLQAMIPSWDLSEWQDIQVNFQIQYGVVSAIIKLNFIIW